MYNNYDNPYLYLLFIYLFIYLFVCLQSLLGGPPSYGPYGVCTVPPSGPSYGASPYGYQQQQQHAPPAAVAAAATYTPGWPPAAVPQASPVGGPPYGGPPRAPLPMPVYGGTPGPIPAPWRPPQ